jgi:glutathione synthase
LERLAKEKGQYANVVLVTIPESPKRIRLDENDGHLYVDGNKRVGLVHMSVGLLPKHWKTEEEWEARFKMERSNAIISPNIRAQLAGTKRIQQVTDPIPSFPSTLI